MTIPTSSNYPDAFDNNTNLFEVHDFLRLRLLDDYSPGDTTIVGEGDETIVARFPPSGLITLTEQCSDIDLRALSFFYSSLEINATNNRLITFNDVEILNGFTDSAKSRRITNITQNVMADHHNNLKNSIIAIEEFVGTEGTTDVKPFGETIEGRINYLYNLVLKPRAWYQVNKRIGIVPFTVVFQDRSFRNPTYWEWDFGDGPISSVSTISTTTSTNSYSVIDLDGGVLSKTYTTPGIFPVSLKVRNQYGEDTVIFEDLITARVPAPDESQISFILSDKQMLHPYTSGAIKARIDTTISIIISDNGENPSDPITSYSWKLPGDDLEHFNLDSTTASYSVGGYYDIKLKVKTRFNSYRITTFEDYIDVIEKTNLWYMGFSDEMNYASINYTKTAFVKEFGLLSETFKETVGPGLSVTRDHSFLSISDPELARQRYEFIKNNGSIEASTTTSGDLGQLLTYWSEGGATLGAHTIRFKKLTGFTSTWTDEPSLTTLNRTWNWIDFPNPGRLYIAFGNESSQPPGQSPVSEVKTSINLNDFSTSDVSLVSTDFANGAEELLTNIDNGVNGHFSVYRSCWRGSEGFLARNDGAGTFFRIRSFYKTTGTITEPFTGIRKLTDIPGNPKYEGRLVGLTGGVYFFNNTGQVQAYNASTNIWSTATPNTISGFKVLQDSSVLGFDDESNTLLATSDNDRRVYLSFDYSPNTFIKFNEVDLSFSSLTARPAGEQWQLKAY